MSTAALTAAEDWELDFYSRPILEADGRKRWELLITSTPAASGDAEPFRFAKVCPSGDVNSLWLSQALAEAKQASASGAGVRPYACAAGAVRCAPWCSAPQPNKTSR